MIRKLWVILLLVSVDVHANFQIACGFRPQADFYSALYSEAFARLGKTIEFHKLPNERANRLVNEGVMDAECSRSPRVLTVFKNFIKVPEKTWDVQFVAFTKKDNITIEKWDDLKSLNAVTAVGFKLAELQLLKLRPHSMVSVPNATGLFKMLDSERIDAAVITKIVGETQIKTLSLSDITIQQPALTKIPMFLMLNKKHKNLVEPLTKIFIDMKRDGSWQRILKSSGF